MRHNTVTDRYLPVPDHLHPIAEQIENTRIPLNRTRLDADRADENNSTSSAPNTTQDKRARRLLDERATACGEDRYVAGQLAIAPRSHALVELSGLRHSYHLFRHYLAVPTGHTLRFVDFPLVPFTPLAHLADDAQLAAAVDSGDLYEWLGQRLDLARTVAKQGIFLMLTGATPEHMARRLAAGGHDPDAALPKIATIPDLFPDTFTYMAQLAPYTTGIAVAQAVANRVANTGLGLAHDRLVHAGVSATAAILVDPSTVAYLVPDDASKSFTDTVNDLPVTAEGITVVAAAY